MMRREVRLLALALATIFLGAGCTTSVTDMLPTAPPSAVEQEDSGVPATDPVTEGSQSDDAPDESMQALAKAQAYYIEYSDDEFNRARAEGRPIALYFWAAWCPICRAEEPKIREQIDGLDIPVTGFRVNFDTETELKKRYGIPYQHTLVILDTEGNETSRFLGPVEDEERYEAYLEAANR